jgi:hypothetical protein
MQINLLDTFIVDEESEPVVLENISGNLYPGEVLRFNYEKEKLIDVKYVRKGIL